MAIDNVGVDVAVEFDDSMSNISRYTQGADFMSNERTHELVNEYDEAYPNSAKSLKHMKRFLDCGAKIYPYVITGVRRRRRRSSQSEAVVYLKNGLT